MNDPRRWLESANASQRVLDVLRHAQPPRALDRATRERSRRRIAALGAVPAAGAALLLQHVAFGAVLGSAVMAAVVGPRLWSAPEPASSAAVRVVPKRVNQPISRRLEPATAPSAASVPEPQGSAARVRPAQSVPEASLPLGPPSDKAEDGSDLVREARMLESARRLLETDPERALSQLASHERSFGAGALALEREFLSITALMRLGRSAEATARATRLRALAPGSLYEHRLERLLASSAERGAE